MNLQGVGPKLMYSPLKTLGISQTLLSIRVGSILLGQTPPESETKRNNGLRDADYTSWEFSLMVPGLRKYIRCHV